VWQSGVFLSRLDVEHLAREEFQAPGAQLVGVAGNVTAVFHVAHEDRVHELDVLQSLRSHLTSTGGAMGEVALVELRCGNSTAAQDGDVLRVDAAAGAPIEVVLEVTQQDLDARPYVAAIWIERALMHAWENDMCAPDLTLSVCEKVSVAQHSVQTTGLVVSLNVTSPGTRAWPVNASRPAVLTDKLNSMFAGGVDTAFTTHLALAEIDQRRCAPAAFSSGTRCTCHPGTECSVPEDPIDGCVNGTNVTCQVKTDTGSGGRRDGSGERRDDSVVFTTFYILYVVFLLLLHTYTLFAYRGWRLRG
jgi:hypothetical protein